MHLHRGTYSVNHGSNSSELSSGFKVHSLEGAFYQLINPRVYWRVFLWKEYKKQGLKLHRAKKTSFYGQPWKGLLWDDLKEASHGLFLLMSLHPNPARGTSSAPRPTPGHGAWGQTHLMFLPLVALFYSGMIGLSAREEIAAWPQS